MSLDKYVASALCAALGVAPLDAADLPPMEFNPPDTGQIEANLVVGQPFAFSLCLGTPVEMPNARKRYTRANARLLGATQCGGSRPSPTVSGGSGGPYKFHVCRGFLPQGLSLDPQTGVLWGTPTQGFEADFGVEALDLGNRSSGCQPMRLQPRPRAARQADRSKGQDDLKDAPNDTSKARGGQRGGGGAADVGMLILGLAGAAGLAVVAANAIQQQQTEQSGQTSRCGSGALTCPDGRCCGSDSSCCGYYSGREVCCPLPFGVYCPSTNRCYDTLPSCDYTVCARPARGSGALGAMTLPEGAGRGVLLPGARNATTQEGVPPLEACPPVPE
jgi:hypothetical protein